MNDVSIRIPCAATETNVEIGMTMVKKGKERHTA